MTEQERRIVLNFIIAYERMADMFCIDPERRQAYCDMIDLLQKEGALDETR